MTTPRVPLPNEAPLLPEDFQDIIEPLPLPSQLPYIRMPSRQQVTPLPPTPQPVVTDTFIPPPRLMQ